MMHSRNQPSAWEARLARAKMPAYLGYEAEQHGKARRRVLSLDVYPDLAEKAAALAVWDEYALGQDAEARDANATLAAVPQEIRAIGEKRVLGLTLTSAEWKRLQRFRAGTYTGRRGRPKNVREATQTMRGKSGRPTRLSTTAAENRQGDTP